MAIITSAATGNWSATGTWVGGVVPGNGDQAILAHAVTADEANRIIGTSPAGPGTSTPAIEVTVGSLTIPAGNQITCRGALVLGDGNLTINSDNTGGAAVLEIDSSQATDPTNQHYQVQIGKDHLDTGILITTGTATNRSIIRGNPSGGFPTFLQAKIAGGFRCSFTHFKKLGKLQFWNNATYAPQHYWDDCLFEDIETLERAVNITGACKVRMQRCHFTGTRGTNSFYFSTDGTGVGSGERLVTENWFDSVVKIVTPGGFVITYNAFNKKGDHTSSSPWTYEKNFVRTVQQAATQMCASIKDCYIYQDWAANPHGIGFGALGAGSYVCDGVIFDSPRSDLTGDGDRIIIGQPSTATTYEVKNCIKLPARGGVFSGQILSALGNSNNTISIHHNTSHAHGVAVGETYGGHAGMVTRFDSNIVWKDAPATGFKLFDSGADDNVPDLITSANCDFNCGHNVLTGSEPLGYNNLEFSSGAPGANDVDEDPSFVNKNANFATWAQDNWGRNGTDADALTFLEDSFKDFTAPAKIDDLFTYIRAAFAPTNTNLAGAGKSGTDIGAVAVASGPSATPSVTPSATPSATPSPPPDIERDTELSITVTRVDLDETHDQNNHVLLIGAAEESGVIDIAASPTETTIALSTAVSPKGLTYFRNVGSNQVKLGYNTGDYPHELPVGTENFIVGMKPTGITTLYATSVGGVGELKMRMLSRP